MVGLIKDRPIQLNKEIAPDLPLVRADPLKVRQILINLLSNAAKFTEKGTVTLRASAVAGSHGMPEVRIEVQDSGPGIASQDHAKLFLPFSQVDGSATRKTGGSGLGLSICRHLVEMHGGQIGLTSTLGTGSTFYFTLPMQPLRKLTGSLGLPPDAPLILAIDDERQIVHLYERYLHGHGYRVIGVNDPTQAAAAARQHHPVAITLDVMMPGRDGWQVLAELKSDPDTRDIPVIMCTILEEQGKGFSMGATDYLMKPILEDDLVQALNRINKNGESREIMLIDIDPTDRRLVQRVLMDHPEYRLVLIESGAKALTHIRARQPHAILLDLDMPDLDGFTLLETLRADPILVDIPVIILADGNLPEEQHTRLSLISQALLTKGLISEDELFKTLESSLKRYS
jgi:CheY-like chemotaxis protein